jgi:hypothetical protein
MERKGRGINYHEVDNDDNNDGKGGEQGKSINDSISEHKCIITSNIISLLVRVRIGTPFPAHQSCP